MNWFATHSSGASVFSAIALLQQPPEPHFSWVQGFVVPVLFTVFGAALGFLASQVTDWRNARRAKKSFVRAVGMELDALGTQLDASLQEVKDSTERTARGGSAAPQFAGTLRTTVFTSQLGKLRDVADPLMIEIIHFYSDLGTLQQTLEIFNDLASEYNRAHVFSGEREAIRPHVQSGLRVLQEQMSGCRNHLRQLRGKLPPVPAEQPK